MDAIEDASIKLGETVRLEEDQKKKIRDSGQDWCRAQARELLLRHWPFQNPGLSIEPAALEVRLQELESHPPEQRAGPTGPPSPERA
ncbi:hypothetical protein DYH09_17030 [bacterium CPR1]|nr:hypothetical protein [bacterium CPR1]